jgi:hypothetical protein
MTARPRIQPIPLLLLEWRTRDLELKEHPLLSAPWFAEGLHVRVRKLSKDPFGPHHLSGHRCFSGHAPSSGSGLP